MKLPENIQNTAAICGWVTRLVRFSSCFCIGLQGRGSEHLHDNAIGLDGRNPTIHVGYLLGQFANHPLKWLYYLFIALGVALFDTLYLCEMFFTKLRDGIRLVIAKACQHNIFVTGVEAFASDALRALDERRYRLTEDQKKHRRNQDDCQRPDKFAHSNMVDDRGFNSSTNNESRTKGYPPTAIVIGGMEALELMDWMNDQRWIHGPAIRFKFVRINELESLTYNGLPIRLSENDGIDILT